MPRLDGYATTSATLYKWPPRSFWKESRLVSKQSRRQTRPCAYIHRKHVDRVDVEDLSHRVVAEDLPAIVRVLQVVGLDVFPNLFDDLRSGALRRAIHPASVWGTT